MASPWTTVVAQQEGATLLCPLDYSLAVDAVIQSNARNTVPKFTWTLACQHRVGCSAHGAAAGSEYSLPHSRPTSSSSTQYLTAIQMTMTMTGVVKLQTVVINNVYRALTTAQRLSVLPADVVQCHTSLWCHPATLYGVFLSPVCYPPSQMLWSWSPHHLSSCKQVQFYLHHHMQKILLCSNSVPHHNIWNLLLLTTLQFPSITFHLKSPRSAAYPCSSASMFHIHHITEQCKRYKELTLELIY